MAETELSQSVPSSNDRALATTVLLLTFSRIMVNAGRRFAYPYLPEISRELGVSQASVQSVVGLQAGIGITSPAFGPLAERYGRKRVMIGSLILMSAVAGIGALFPTFGVFAMMMVLLGAGKMIFDPAMGAYIGDRVPYSRRGMAFGVMELAWAGALIVSAPVVGWLLDTSSLRAVMAALGGGLLIATLIVQFATPADHPGHTGASITPPVNLIAALRIVFTSRAAVACLFYALLVAIANEIFFINYGQFMETSFGLKLAEIGAATTVIALAEVCGEFTVIGTADRFGKRRLSLIAAVIASTMYLILPLLNGSLTLALIGLFIMFMAVETSIVASIALFSEVLPESRSVMLSSTLSAACLGRLIGSVSGGLLYSLTGSFLTLGVISLVIGYIAITLLWRFVSDPHASRTMG